MHSMDDVVGHEKTCWLLSQCIVVPRNYGDKLRLIFFYNVPYPFFASQSTLNPKSFHTFDLNEDGASCNSTEETF